MQGAGQQEDSEKDRRKWGKPWKKQKGRKQGGGTTRCRLEKANALVDPK